jgi:hypothetical protein
LNSITLLIIKKDRENNRELYIPRRDVSVHAATYVLEYAMLWLVVVVDQSQINHIDYWSLPPFQIIGRFWFFRFIDIYYASRRTVYLKAQHHLCI